MAIYNNINPAATLIPTANGSVMQPSIPRNTGSLAKILQEEKELQRLNRIKDLMTSLNLASPSVTPSIPQEAINNTINNSITQAQAASNNPFARMQADPYAGLSDEDREEEINNEVAATQPTVTPTTTPQSTTTTPNQNQTVIQTEDSNTPEITMEESPLKKVKKVTTDNQPNNPVAQQAKTTGKVSTSKKKTTATKNTPKQKSSTQNKPVNQTTKKTGTTKITPANYKWDAKRKLWVHKTTGKTSKTLRIVAPNEKDEFGNTKQYRGYADGKISENMPNLGGGVASDIYYKYNNNNKTYDIYRNTKKIRTYKAGTSVSILSGNKKITLRLGDKNSWETPYIINTSKATPFIYNSKGKKEDWRHQPTPKEDIGNYIYDENHKVYRRVNSDGTLTAVKGTPHKSLISKTKRI